MENDKLMSIGKTSKSLGVSIQTLRRWDSKGILKSFRASPGGNRFYKKEDIDLFINDLSSMGWKWASDIVPSEPPKEFYCATSDVFTIRLKRLESDLEKLSNLNIHPSLLMLMVSEIGDNSYAHNLGNWPDVLGIFFAYDLNKRKIILADRGRGILETLQSVRPELQSHSEALKVAFTEILSGRFPERRGNGLKSVARTIITSDVKLLFRTGDAQLDLKRGDEGPNITKYQFFHGCYAVLNF